ncbi:MAG: hypothetical protein IJ587_00325 [Synergistaceae bacterium]|nr:hypothetical protein [Synergistaceae bacterium]
MTQDLREEIKKYIHKHDNSRLFHFYTPADFEYEEELQQKMRFDSPEDVDFELMDFYFDGMLSRILKHAGVCAHDYRNWGRAYEEFKPYVSDYVGWYSFESKEKHPMLCSQEAYSLMLEMLDKACHEGADKRRRKRKWKE